jgi:hypothetical protein
MAKKVFRVPRASRPPEEFDLVFEVREQEKINIGTEVEPVWEMRDAKPERWVEETRTFSARMNIPSGITLNLSPPKPGDLEGAARQGQALRDLLRLAVVETDAFFEVLDSTRTVVEGEQLGEICRWIVEESGDRPTNGPSPS